MVGLLCRLGVEPLWFIVKPTLVGSELITKIMNALMHATACGRKNHLQRWMRMSFEDTSNEGFVPSYVPNILE
jgi:hypothetical protein